MLALSATLALSFVAQVALGHVDINYPLGAWNGTEEQQETGAICGGAARAAAYSWGTQQPFVSLSGDPGQSVRVLLSTTNSTSTNTSISSAESFPIVLAGNATFSSSGNLCLPVNIPGTYVTGSRATLFVEASGGEHNEAVSACAELVLVPTNVNNLTVVASDGHDSGVTYYNYYCSNSTIAALDTCTCHCHETHAHCSSSCPTDRLAAANEGCANGTGVGGGQDSHDDDHDDHPHSSSIVNVVSTSNAGSGSLRATGTAAAASSSSTARSDAVRSLKVGSGAVVLVALVSVMM
ncbi:hypothetical protein T439DRAFT_322573 [Meredithblackwellia eburnea MCA 4105]